MSRSFRTITVEHIGLLVIVTPINCIKNFPSAAVSSWLLANHIYLGVRIANIELNCPSKSLFCISLKCLTESRVKTRKHQFLPKFENLEDYLTKPDVPI